MYAPAIVFKCFQLLDKLPLEMRAPKRMANRNHKLGSLRGKQALQKPSHDHVVRSLLYQVWLGEVLQNVN